jgi:hypothetical protein
MGHSRKWRTLSIPSPIAFFAMGEGARRADEGAENLQYQKINFKLMDEYRRNFKFTRGSATFKDPHPPCRAPSPTAKNAAREGIDSGMIFLGQ